MKIKVAVKELVKKVQRASTIAQEKSTIPVLSNVLLNVTAVDKATMSCSNLSECMLQGLDIQLLSENFGSMLLPAKKLAQFLAVFPSDGEVILESNGEKISVKNRKFKWEGTTPPVATFPAIEAKPDTQFNLNTAAVKTLISRVEYAAPSKPGRHSVPSVQLESSGTNLRAAATDGFRIALADAPGAGAGDFALQLPKTLLPLLKEIPGNVIAFAASDTNFFFQGEGEQLVIRKPNTKFPAYQKVIPTAPDYYKTSIVLPVPTLKSLIEVISPVLDAKSPAIKLEVGSGQLTVSGGSNVEGFASDEVEVTQTGTPNAVCLNPKYLLDIMGIVEGKLTVNLSTEKTIAKFTNEKGDFNYYLMPKQEKAEEKQAEKA